MQMYKLFIVLSAICILLSLIKRPRKMKLKNLNKSYKENLLIKKLDSIISKNKKLNDTKKMYVAKLQIINYKNREYNNELILIYLLLDIAASTILFLILSNIMTMWYAVIIIDLVVFYMIIYFGIIYIQSKINKIHSHFPIALQCFLDEYIIYNNIKNAINTSYRRMPSEIGNVFELLSRELSGGKDYEESIYRFANELSYVWGYSFAEILTISYEGAGDITNDLLTLNSMVSEEITSEEENKSSRFANKMTFIILNSVALVGFIINMFVNHLSRHLYFYTTTGNTIITIWLTVLIIGITVISISENN